MKGSADGLFDWTPNTNHLYLSSRMKEMYGYKPHELENTLEAMKSLIHPEDYAEAYAGAQRYLAREIPSYQHVFRVRHKDGNWRWVMSRGAAQWNSKGQPTRMVGTHTDVTSLKQMEDELREAKQRADSANRAKSNFLANNS
jgi:PAS domain S-box-containing protein